MYQVSVYRTTGPLVSSPEPWSGIRRLSVICSPSVISNVFSSETTWPIEAKFYVQTPWQGGKKVYINGPGHMTFKNLLLQNRQADFHETWYVALGTPAHHILYK